MLRHGAHYQSYTYPIYRFVASFVGVDLTCFHLQIIFDCVPHLRMLHNLNEFGFSGRLHKFIMDLSIQPFEVNDRLAAFVFLHKLCRIFMSGRILLKGINFI